MQVKTLYRYEREPNCVTVSTEKPLDVEYAETYRLIADKGMILTNGATETVSVDTDKPNDWQEIVDKYYIPEEELVNE